MAAFKIILSNGHEMTFRKNQGAEARNVPNYDDAQRFFVGDAEVTAVEFYAACDSDEAARLAKKNVTHKRIMVATGVASLDQNRKAVWVRR